MSAYVILLRSGTRAVVRELLGLGYEVDELLEAFARLVSLEVTPTTPDPGVTLPGPA